MSFSSVLDERGLPPHYPWREGWEVTPRQVKALRDAGEDLLLIDCRTPREYEAARIEGATLIPLHETPRRLAELEPYRQRKIIIHCHHGMRSLQMAAFLRRAGFRDVHSMAGGIDLWALDVDSQVGRY